MQFNTNRLTIRNVIYADWHDILEIWKSLKDSPFAKYDKPTDISEPAVRERIAKWSSAIDNPDHQFFSVILNERIIGYVAFNIRSDGYEIGYSFHKAFHGMGYAKESILELLNYMKNAGVKKIIARTALENTPSVNLLNSIGFSLIDTEQVSFYKMKMARILFSQAVFLNTNDCK